MGWLELRVSKDAGGSGLGAREFCSRAEQLGAELVPEPLIPAAMAAQLLPPDHLAPVLAGDRIIMPAWQEKPDSIEPVGATVLRNGRLSGRKLLIPMATGADAFLVTVPGCLALVERDAPGVSLEI
jgi:alkylation response protein AidB-like acyl-CoA dehydrogenase